MPPEMIELIIEATIVKFPGRLPSAMVDVVHHVRDRTLVDAQHLDGSWRRARGWDVAVALSLLSVILEDTSWIQAFDPVEREC